MTESCDYNCSECPLGYEHEMGCADAFENELVTVNMGE